MGRFTTAVAAYAANVDNLPNKDKLPEVSLWEAVLPTSLSDLVGKQSAKKKADGEKKDGVEKVEKADMKKGEEKVSCTGMGSCHARRCETRRRHMRPTSLHTSLASDICSHGKLKA